MQTVPLESLRLAADRAALLYLHQPDVSLIDVGWRIRDRQSYQLETTLCVRVHLRLTKPRGLAFEAFIASHPDRVIDARRIGLPENLLDLPGGTNYRLHIENDLDRQRGWIWDPMCGGISISNASENGFATLGGPVLDRTTGEPMILSNWHVLASPYCGPTGLSTYQPGRWDGGNSTYEVAALARSVLDQGIDAAVATLTGARAIVNDQVSLGQVTGVAAPQLGMRVVKSGRRTGITRGIITGLDGRQMMPYGSGTHLIRHVVHIAPLPEGGEVSAPGDSGSWWLEESTHRAVALHFAGCNQPEYALGLAMPQVLDALNVDLVTDTVEH
ncbi:MAG: hypothetical protein U0559_18445 [Anaerolineae bacterium]